MSRYSYREVVWENLEAFCYDDEPDADYLVRIPNGIRRTEWRIIHTKTSREEAIRAAQEYTKEHPGVPVRIERYVI